MFLTGYRKEIFLPECNSSFQSLHCTAYLNEDIADVLPYLNAEMGGHQYTADPPSVTFKIYGRLITLQSRKIAINALDSAEQADKILEWLKVQKNDIWARREEIEPSVRPPARPGIIELLRILPRTNCKKCGLPTCMVFATYIIEGGKGAEDCSELTRDKKRELEQYLGQFGFSHYGHRHTIAIQNTRAARNWRDVSKTGSRPPGSS